MGSGLTPLKTHLSVGRNALQNMPQEAFHGGQSPTYSSIHLVLWTCFSLVSLPTILNSYIWLLLSSITTVVRELPDFDLLVAAPLQDQCSKPLLTVKIPWSLLPLFQKKQNPWCQSTIKMQGNLISYCRFWCGTGRHVLWYGNKFLRCCKSNRSWSGCINHDQHNSNFSAKTNRCVESTLYGGLVRSRIKSPNTSRWR